ncbi:MAG: CocE/NonD family hydrolase [Gemmatimonadota bacterium]
MRPAAVLVLVVLAFHARRAPAQQADSSFVFDSNVAVPMRDGVQLRADVLRPAGLGPFPVLVYRTPYGKTDALKDYTTFTAAVHRGYAVVVQDVRGRFGSAGGFVAYQHEGKDGFDTIEWAARQPWSNGLIGTFGLSYPGAVQWLAAVENPPHLKAMVPAMTFATPRRFFYSGGVWDLSWVNWIWADIAPDVRAARHLPGPQDYAAASAAWDSVGDSLVGQLPLRSMAAFRGIAPWYYEWLAHPPADPWWNWAELAGRYGKTSAAVLNLSGWHDEAYGPSGAVRNFLGLRAARRHLGSANTHLLIGPWAHGVDGTGRSTVGKREMGDQARIDYDDVVLRWMDHYLRGIDNGVDREPAVRVYVMGEGRWLESARWPVADDSITLYLTGDSAAGLSPTAPSAEHSGDMLESDPANPVTDPYGGYSGAHDYRDFIRVPGLLTFDSQPMTQDLTVVGAIHARIYLSTTGRDSDLWVRILDVTPDGTTWNLMNPGLDLMRASYRHETRTPELLTPGRPYALDLNELLTGNRFLAGHRIRVQISTAFFPWFSRNLNSGESEIASDRMQKARVTIYHDRVHASKIVLPVVSH